MGVTCPHNLFLVEKLNIQKRDLTMQIENNHLKLLNLEKEIEEIEDKISEGENDIRLNQSLLNENELRNKAKKLVELNRDKQRNIKSLEYILTINETLKNNLESIDKKIIEYQNMPFLNRANNIMDSNRIEDNAQILANNTNTLLKQREEEEKIQKLLEEANKAYLGNEYLKNEEEYLKNLLEPRNKKKKKNNLMKSFYLLTLIFGKIL